MANAELEVRQLFRDSKNYSRLISKKTLLRERLNQIAFEISVERDYQDIALIFIQKEKITVTWQMISKMLTSHQSYLVRQCIKYAVKFNSTATEVKKVIFAGATTSTDGK